MDVVDIVFLYADCMQPDAVSDKIFIATAVVIPFNFYPSDIRFRLRFFR